MVLKQLFVTFAFVLIFAQEPHIHGSNQNVCFMRSLYLFDSPDANNDTLCRFFLTQPDRGIVMNNITRKSTRSSIALFSQNNIVYFSARTRFMDEELLKGIKSGIKQVIILGSGYDTRAYRFYTSGVQFFEVDFPEVIESKKNATKALGFPQDQVTYVGADLSKYSLADVMNSYNDFDRKKPTFFMVEGLIYYLEQSAVDDLFANISMIAAPGSTLQYDFINKCVIDTDCPTLGKFSQKFLMWFGNLTGEPFKSGMEISNQPNWLGDMQFSITRFVDFSTNAAEQLNLTTWKDDPHQPFGQMNCVSAQKNVPPPQ